MPLGIELGLGPGDFVLDGASVYLFINFVRNLQLCVQEQLPELYTYEPLLAVLPLPSFENSV